jgi:Na+-translocating membrane potential-generating system (MpsC)
VVSCQSRCGDRLEVRMKSQGEIEAAVCEGMTRFEQEYMGRGPKDIHAHLIGDLLVVRLQGVLTAAEQQLVKSHQPEKGTPTTTRCSRYTRPTAGYRRTYDGGQSSHRSRAKDR